MALDEGVGSTEMQGLPGMSAIKHMRLKYPGQALLNEVADYILEEKHDLIDRLAGFELVEGPASLMGSGDQAIVEIVIRYEALDEAVLEDIKQIIAFANRGATEVIVEIDDVQD